MDLTAAAHPDAPRAVGRVVRSHGLRGELVVEPSTDHLEARFSGGVVLEVLAPAALTARVARLTVTASRMHAGRLLVTVEEAADRDTADALRGAVLGAAPLEGPTGDPDEFGDHELEGLDVVHVDGRRLGVVTAVRHGAGPELLAVDVAGSEYLVPFVSAIVVEVDPAGGRLVVDPPEGLLGS